MDVVITSIFYLKNLILSYKNYTYIIFPILIIVIFAFTFIEHGEV